MQKGAKLQISLVLIFRPPSPTVHEPCTHGMRVIIWMDIASLSSFQLGNMIWETVYLHIRLRTPGQTISIPLCSHYHATPT